MLHKNSNVIIECDKCHDTSTAGMSNYNEVFFEQGWTFQRGRKYTHLCFKCKSSKAKKTNRFVREKFNIGNDAGTSIMGVAER